MKRTNKQLVVIILLMVFNFLLLFLLIKSKEENAINYIDVSKSYKNKNLDFINNETLKFNSDLKAIDSILYDILMLELTSSDLQLMNFENSASGTQFLKNGQEIIILLRMIDTSQMLDITDSFYEDLRKKTNDFYLEYENKVPFNEKSNIYFIRSSSENVNHFILNRLNVQLLMANIETMMYRFLLYSLYNTPPEKYQPSAEYEKYFDKSIKTHLW